jgi:endoglucanase
MHSRSIVSALSSAAALLILASVPVRADRAAAPMPPITDPFRMNQLLGRGVNFGNALEAPTEGDWGVVLEDEYFDLVKQAGFSSIRLPVRWSAHAQTEKPYAIDPAFLKRVDWAVANALSRNLPIIVNIHHYRETYRDPLGQKERFLALWRQIAEHYKDYSPLLVFEVMNEPKSVLYPRIWNVYIKEALAVIRQSNPHRTVLVGPASDNIIAYLQYLEIPEDDRNIIVTVHHYFPLEFTHQGAAWLSKSKGDSSKWLGTRWTGTPAEQKAIIDAFDTAAAWAREHHRPLNVGEFGAYAKGDLESRVRWTKFIADSAIARGFSFDYWEFCAAEFGIYDQKAKVWLAPLRDALIPPKQ